MVSRQRMIYIEQVDRLTDVDPSEWDRLAGRSVLASYGWWRTVESTRLSQSRPRYILARTADGLVGAVCCEIQEPASDHAGLDALLFGRFRNAARHLRLNVLPSLVCGGAPIGARAPILVRSDLPADERRRLTTDLVQAVEDTARGHGWTVCFRGVGRERSPISDVLAARGYLRSPELPTACLELDPSWRSFAEYRRGLKRIHHNTEKGIRRELNRARRTGLVIDQVVDPRPCADRLHALLTSHYARLNGKPFPFCPDFLDQLKSRLGDRALIYVARVGEALVGVVIGLRDADEVSIAMVGMDADAGRDSSAYFNLGYNRPIEDAIAAGHRRIYFGRLVYDLKARRGCVRVDSDLYLRVWSRTQAHALRALLIVRTRRMGGMAAALPPHKSVQS
jgi:predicted N-acyltransferase